MSNNTDTPPVKNEGAGEIARLESLSRRSGTRSPLAPASSTPAARTTPMPSRGGTSVRGRFLPKAVARRSKEERDASAPTESKIVNTATRGRSDRGRGGARGGRGGGRGGRFDSIASTAAVGPLAAPSVVDTRNSRRSQIGGSVFGTGTGSAASRHQGEALLAQLGRVKSDSPEPSSRGSTPGPYYDNRIDMSSTERIEGELSSQFPVRMDRDESLEVADDEKNKHIGADESVSEELKKLQIDFEVLSNEIFGSSDKPRGESEVKEIHEITENSVEVEAKIKAEPGTEEVDINVKEEVIVKVDQEPSSNKLLFMQFPVLFPKFVSSQAPAAENNDIVMTDESPEAAKPDDKEDEKDEDNISTKPKAPVGNDLFPQEGRIGTLRRHKSGKLSMIIGDMEMEVSRGNECRFLQDIVVHSEEQNGAYLIGQVGQRIVVTPDLSQMEL